MKPRLPRLPDNLANTFEARPQAMGCGYFEILPNAPPPVPSRIQPPIPIELSDPLSGGQYQGQTDYGYGYGCEYGNGYGNTSSTGSFYQPQQQPAQRPPIPLSQTHSHNGGPLQCDVSLTLLPPIGKSGVPNQPAFTGPGQDWTPLWSGLFQCAEIEVDPMAAFEREIEDLIFDVWSKQVNMPEEEVARQTQRITLQQARQLKCPLAQRRPASNIVKRLENCALNHMCTYKKKKRRRRKQKKGRETIRQPLQTR